jgi:hypothetical protein
MENRSALPQQPLLQQPNAHPSHQGGNSCASSSAMVLVACSCLHVLSISCGTLGLRSGLRALARVLPAAPPWALARAVACALGPRLELWRARRRQGKSRGRTTNGRVRAGWRFCLRGNHFWIYWDAAPDDECHE